MAIESRAGAYYLLYFTRLTLAGREHWPTRTVIGSPASGRSVLRAWTGSCTSRGPEVVDLNRLSAGRSSGGRCKGCQQGSASESHAFAVAFGAGRWSAVTARRLGFCAHASASSDALSTRHSGFGVAIAPSLWAGTHLEMRARRDGHDHGPFLLLSKVRRHSTIQRVRIFVLIVLRFAARGRAWAVRATTLLLRVVAETAVGNVTTTTGRERSMWKFTGLSRQCPDGFSGRKVGH